ncbi:uncharacterized protein TNCT_219641 [Trichonephila clavata]|uniref:Uncharacterized protein n=1 Tax=Trichonephila clavata TaxID=2740835 RepID=A0A8X6HAD8_TRICU|nr:uncharacterized protein TNCT_219641 [Trichonephila clavata]
MWTLKDIILVNLAAGFIKDSATRRTIFCCGEKIWKRVLRERISDLNIPITLREDIIALIKPIKSEVLNWREDHLGIFTMDQDMPLNAQELLLDFYFNPDGTVDRVKTADLFVHSEEFDVQTRFVVACQYWSKSEVLVFFKNLHESAREQILHKYSSSNGNLNKYEKNVAEWLFCYRNGHIDESRGCCSTYCYWTIASLQSRLLDHISPEERLYLLENVFKKTRWIHVQRFCLSRMSADHREDLLRRYPLKFLRTCLFWPWQRFFLDSINKVWDRLPKENFTCLLHIIICQKVLERLEDFDYVNLLREFWYRSPEHLKQYVERTDLFKIMMKIIKNGFRTHPENVPVFLHDSKFVNNAAICDRIIRTIIKVQ